MRASLITTVVAISCQSDVAWEKSEYFSNSLSKFSSLVDFCYGTLLLILFSFEMMFSMISFTVISVDFKSAGVLSVFFFKLLLSPIFPQKHLILKDMSSQHLICCEALNDKVPVGNVLSLLLLMCHFCLLLMLL